MSNNQGAYLHAKSYFFHESQRTNGLYSNKKIPSCLIKTSPDCSWSSFQLHLIVSSIKQKLNTRSSIESELVSVDDMMPTIVLSCYFPMAQGNGVTQNLLLQDNKRSMLLEKNCKHQAVSVHITLTFNTSSLQTGLI